MGWSLFKSGFRKWLNQDLRHPSYQSANFKPDPKPNHLRYSGNSPRLRQPPHLPSPHLLHTSLRACQHSRHHHLRLISNSWPSLIWRLINGAIQWLTLLVAKALTTLLYGTFNVVVSCNLFWFDDCSRHIQWMVSSVVKGQARIRNRRKKRQLAKHGAQWDGDTVSGHIQSSYRPLNLVHSSRPLTWWKLTTTWFSADRSMAKSYYRLYTTIT